MRFYAILLRKYGTSCECTIKEDLHYRSDADGAYCRHPHDRPLDEWEPRVARKSRLMTLYESIASVRRGLGAATRSEKREHCVVFFDSDDMLDVTDDRELAYQQREARFERDGRATEQARAEALAPPASPEPAKPKRKRAPKKNVPSPSAPVPAASATTRPLCVSCDGQGEIGYFGIACMACGGTGVG